MGKDDKTLETQSQLAIVAAAVFVLRRRCHHYMRRSHIRKYTGIDSAIGAHARISRCCGHCCGPCGRWWDPILEKSLVLSHKVRQAVIAANYCINFRTRCRTHIPVTQRHSRMRKQTSILESPFASTSEFRRHYRTLPPDLTAEL